MARDFKPKGEKERPDIFAAIPPLEAQRVLFRKAALAMREGRRAVAAALADVGDIEREARGEVAFINFTDGWCESGKCGKLKRRSYGMRPSMGA